MLYHIVADDTLKGWVMWVNMLFSSSNISLTGKQNGKVHTYLKCLPDKRGTTTIFLF